MGYSLKALSIARGDTGTPPYKLEPSGVYTTTKMSDYFITSVSINGSISPDPGTYRITVSVSGTGSKISQISGSSHLSVIPKKGANDTAGYTFSNISNSGFTVTVSTPGTINVSCQWNDGYNPVLTSNTLS